MTSKRKTITVSLATYKKLDRARTIASLEKRKILKWDRFLNELAGSVITGAR